VAADSQDSRQESSFEPSNLQDKLKETGEKKRKTGRLIAIAIIAGLAVNILLGALMNQDQMLQAISKVRVYYLIIPFLCYFVVSVIDALRLILVLRQCGYSLHFGEALYNAILGQFISNLTPSAAGGQAVQIYHLQKLDVPTKVATNVIFSRFVVNAMILMLVIVSAIPTITGIAGRFKAGDIVMYLGLTSTFLFSLLFLLVLIRPQLITSLAGLADKRFLGKIIGRLSKNPEWFSSLKTWIIELREEIHYLWSHRFLSMILDIFLNILLIAVQGLSVFYILKVVTGADFTFYQVMVTFVVIWQVIFYIPTPGASGSLEGGFAAVYAGLTGKPELTLVAIVVWRVATYYLHVFLAAFLSAIYGKLKKHPAKLITKKKALA